MVKVIYVDEKIHYDKECKCGWSYRKLKIRIDYKTKKTRFFIYTGYCHFERIDQWDDEEEIEEIYIHAEYYHHSKDIKKARLKKKIRKRYWDKGWKFSELKKDIIKN